jgi:superfamily II DNA or RNA helicase
METSETTFLAYQFKPILKLLESPTNSLLIADEVGLGKTIEAGLIWTELKAREGARSLLVVCPPHLVTKWRTELKRRFGVDSQAAGPMDVLERLEEARRSFSTGFALVATYHGLRPPKDWETSDNSPASQLARRLMEWGDTEEPFLDLLVMDEAAIMRNETSQTSKLGTLVTPIAKHRVYLSATPLHTRAKNLFNLLRRLDEDTFPDEQTFSGILEANAPLVALRDAILRGNEGREQLLARLDQAMAFPLLTGNRTLAELRDRIVAETDFPSAKVRAELAYQSERANLLAYVVSRTRRRDIETDPIVREVNTIKVTLTAMEENLYERVTEAVHDYADEQGIGAGFLTVMPQRQVASCIPAAYNRLNIETADTDEVNPDRTWEEQGRSTGPLIEFISKQIAGKFDFAALRESDSKYNRLIEAIRLHWSQHPGSKIVLFAFFKPTLYYLRERLGEQGIATLLLTGDEGGDKQKIVDEFALPKSAPMLLSSEVGSEGLDLQFASVLVNYDLPWNPMVVEQRIGRIHRIGQRSERIVVINLVCGGTVDERIYDRLYDRLDLFKRTLGDIEAVVGPMINALTSDLLSLRLSAEQQALRIERTATAVEVQLQLEEELERDAAVLAAYGDYVVNRIAAAHQRGEWINGADIEAYTLAFFGRAFPATRIQGLDQDQRLFQIELDSEAQYQFDSYLQLMNLRGQTRLSTQEKRRIRFDHRVFKSGGPAVEVVHQAHPLIRFIGYYSRVNRLIQPVAVAVEIPAEIRPKSAEPGLYALISQRWTVDGLRGYEAIHHELRSLETGALIDDDVLVNTLVELAATMGRDCADVPLRGDELLSLLEDRIGDLEYSADAAFHRFLTGTERENDDRKQIQLRGLERFEFRRMESLNTIRAQHLAAGRRALVAATDGKLESLRKKCQAQRQKIERKQTSGDCATIAAGLILLH